MAAVLLAASLGNGNGSDTGGSERGPLRLVASEAKPLPAPIQGESVVQVPGGPLILGGLDAEGASAGGVFQLSAGSPREVGSLVEPLHDAAAVRLGTRVLIFGGGQEASTSAVQSLSIPAAGAAATAIAAGTLPTPRSDLSAVAIGDTAYILGGYDGNSPLSSILATTNGSAFSRVGGLPVPARYLAAAALGGRVYAFGGETASGAPTDAIRAFDPRSGSAQVVGHLPVAVAHASAVALDGALFLLGGETQTGPTTAIWRFEPGGSVAAAGRLPRPIANGAAVLSGGSAYLLGGVGAGAETLPTVIRLRPRRVTPAWPKANASTASSPPFTGKLMIADRGNNRLLVVNAGKRVLWRYPSAAHPAPPGGFYFPDDAFFTDHGTGIISNEEQNERIVQLGFPSGKLQWSFGHPGVTGSEPGYLHEPDDAYLLADGNVSVADAQNCRILLIAPSKRILRTFGDPSECTHEPPRRLGSPNGDTPLADGNILVSEVNGSYIDEITRTGKLVWTVQLPIEYPSDPQQLGPDRYLVADYSRPGGIYEFTRAGRILWSYHPSSGPGMLNHPSLAERLPSGLIAANDDYRDRVVIIDPHRKRIVWQYGRTGEPGTGPDHLKIPDGFDLLAPNGATPTHPFTG
ncbi:MAG TPA: PQQ-binding-like beta-propeller repeat protein [Solirubrobacterales bacterium]|nr:PQQ-binding-like beta-propeller repeat protein [Solirubrobacterales bacterium]